MKKKMLTAITPSGSMTLGNYLGAVKRIVDMQDEYEVYLFLANLHAITVPQNKLELKKNTKEIINLYFACGIDPEKSKVWIQSDVKEHAELGWILNTHSTMGELSRMTQFKDKTNNSENIKGSFIPAGLFTYPTLMAADILLYDIDIVPVGVDQKQHIELTKILANRMNNQYKTEMFKVPEVLLTKDNIKIMDLQEPNKKMSKSSNNIKSIIKILDTPKEIENKIKSAMTDSENLIKFDTENKPGVSNLINIYKLITGLSIKEIEDMFLNKNYKDLKEEVSKSIIELLSPIQERYKYIVENNLAEIWLENGAKEISKLAFRKMNKVKNLIGLNLTKK